MHRVGSVIFASFILVAMPAWAQDPADPDQEGCKDSALLTRMAGCQLYECSTKEFDAAEIIAGKYDPQSGETPMKALEGAIDFRHYVCPAKLSQLQIARNMQAAFKKAGFTLVTSGKDDGDNQVVVARLGAKWIEIRTDFFNEYPTYKQTEVLEQAWSSRSRLPPRRWLRPSRRPARLPCTASRSRPARPRSSPRPKRSSPRSSRC